MVFSIWKGGDDMGQVFLLCAKIMIKPFLLWAKFMTKLLEKLSQKKD